MSLNLVLNREIESNCSNRSTENDEEMNKYISTQSLDYDMETNGSIYSHSLDHETNTFGSISSQSLDYEIESNDFNSITESELSKATEKNEENVIDHVIDVFIAKRRKLLIDHDLNDFILTYEESEIRLITILHVMSVVLLIICTSLFFVLFWPTEITVQVITYDFQISHNTIGNIILHN